MSFIAALRRCAWIHTWVWALSLSPQAHAQAPQLDLPRVRLQAGLYTIDAQVASTDAQHEIGLMYRDQMPEHEGMLFVFKQADRYCFWMKNTRLPLSIAFVDDGGRVVKVAEMQANSTQTHCASQPVRYALEMNKGWFAKRRIGAGYTLRAALWSPR